MWPADSPLTPLTPALLALGVMAYALFLAGASLSARRFLHAEDGRDSARTALFALGVALAHLGEVLPAALAAGADPRAWGWALAAASLAWAPGRRVVAVLALSLAAAILLGVAPALATPLFLFMAWTASGWRRLTLLAMGGVMLTASAAALIGADAAAALRIPLLAAAAFLFWRAAGSARSALIRLGLALTLFPLLLAAAGQWLLHEEEDFRARQRDEAHLRLELVKGRLESLDAHNLGLLKIVAADATLLAESRRRDAGLEYAFRLLARRLDAEAAWLLDTDGRVLAASRADLAASVHADRPYFRKALAGVASVHYRHGDAPGQAWAYVARPLLDDQAEIRAVLAARFDLAEAIGDSIRMDDILLHRQGVLLLGPGGLEQGVLFPLTAASAAELEVDIPRLRQLPALGHRQADREWVLDAKAHPWMWASIPVPGGAWVLSRMISIQPLLEFREERLLLLLLALALPLLGGLHALQNNTFLHLLLEEVKQRRLAEARERQAREEAEAGNRELARHRQHLETLVADRTRELEELNRDLDRRVRDEIAKRKEREDLLIHQSRLAAMGEMIAAIAHQWRQPLNALSLVLQNIQMQHRLGLLTEQSMARMQEKSEQLVQRMSSTIDEFRNFFKPRGEARNFNLADSLRSAAGILEGAFQNHGIRFTMDCDASLELAGIPGEFAQVILNLLANAKDAVLQARRPDPAIHIRASREAEGIVVRVEDNGGGIAADILPRIFDPYFTTKEEGKGSGIGLYMSKMIVENNMQGRLLAENAGEGARIRVILPG